MRRITLAPIKSTAIAIIRAGYAVAIIYIAAIASGANYVTLTLSAYNNLLHTLLG